MSDGVERAFQPNQLGSNECAQKLLTKIGGLAASGLSKTFVCGVADCPAQITIMPGGDTLFENGQSCVRKPGSPSGPSTIDTTAYLSGAYDASWHGDPLNDLALDPRRGNT